MTQNPHLSPQLDAYVALDKPGFAIMVTAPWGVGKTFALRQWLGPRPHLYVSLFGIDSVPAAQEAIFLAAIEQSGADGGLHKKGVDALSKMVSGSLEKLTGAAVDFSAAYRSIVLRNAPRLLIFDDLERTRLSPELLLGFVNRFVEHDERNVILIANEGELERTPEFRRWREKVVGRTITLLPETDSALQTFLEQVTDPDAHNFLIVHKDLLREVFDLSETQNLRLLRQAIQEWVRFYATLPPDIARNDKGIPHLFADFMALTLAYHGAKISREDLRQEYDTVFALWSVNGKIPPEPTPSGAEQLRRRYSEYAMTNLDGLALPGGLAIRVIGDGHAPKEEIAAKLRELALFRDPAADPWISLARWRHTEEGEVEVALKRVDAQLVEGSVSDPYLILHIFGIRLGLARHRVISQSPEDVVQQALSYIADLERTGGLPTDIPARKWEGGLDQDSAYGWRYSEFGTPEFEAIRKGLIAALDRAFHSGNPQRIREFLHKLRSDPTTARSMIRPGGRRHGVPDYSDVPIFIDTDPAEIADYVFECLPDSWSAFLSTFKDRLAFQECLVPSDGVRGRSERNWMLHFRSHAMALAEAAGQVRGAQITTALDWHLKFLDPPPASEG